MKDALFFTLFIFVLLFSSGVYDYFKNKKTIPFGTIENIQYHAPKEEVIAITVIN